MVNERLRNTLLSSPYTEASLAAHLGLDTKSVQRWITKNITPAGRPLTAPRKP